MNSRLWIRPAPGTHHAWRLLVGRQPWVCEVIETPMNASSERLGVRSNLAETRRLIVKRFTHALAALITVACLASAQAAPGASDSVALKLMAECKAATGGMALDRPAAFHETGTIVRDGKSGTYEMYADLHALRTAGIHTIEGKIGGGGYDGTRAWHFGPDGKVVIITDPAQLAQEKFGAYLTIGGYFYPDRFAATFKYLGRKKAGSRSYDVVAVTPEGSLTGNLWLDTHSHRIMRVTIDFASMTGEILRYRVVDGTWIGFRNRQSEGPHKMIQTLATLQYVPLDPERFSPPSFGQ